VQLPNNAVRVRHRTASIVVEDLDVLDTFVFGGPDEVPATISYDITWTRNGPPRFLSPGSDDPTDPTNLYAVFRDAVAEGSFTAESVTEPGGDPFSFEGAFATSAPVWGQMGYEANGSFIGVGRDSPEDPLAVEKEALRLPGMLAFEH